jgi:hypothetical protein
MAMHGIISPNEVIKFNLFLGGDIMWNITKEARKRFETCNLLPIHESDEEWEVELREAEIEGENLQSRLKEELEEVKDELLQVLPSRFVPYLENGMLNQPTLTKEVRVDYLEWIRERDLEFEQRLDAANENTENTVTYLPKSVQEVFEESLHDTTIERIEREENTLHLYINADGGFTSKSMIHLIFKDVITEESAEPIQVGQWFLYNELQKTKEGFAFRVLFDVPDDEWTITMKDMDAEYYYRPSLYTKLRDEDKLEEISITEYLSQLNTDHRYWFITPHIICSIESIDGDIKLENGTIAFGTNEFTINVKSECYNYDLGNINPLSLIYTDTFENPYEQFDVPLPVEELETAALGEDLELQVRAWNTMYANPTELADIINHVLNKTEITEENEMMLSVFVDFFYQEGILTDSMIKKYHALLD